MRGLLLMMLVGLAAFGAEGEWVKVKALKTGAEIRVYKKGSMQPVLAQMDELTDENLIVIVKKTQTAIPKDQIDRVDARPSGGSRVTRETTTKETFPDSKAAADAGQAGPAGPTTSTSTSVSMGSKPDFETVYRRPAGAPKKLEQK
jgi:hypothetical protein